jgi:regulator of protease activity HflC (stomatin/prohibitin superfamily)
VKVTFQVTDPKSAVYRTRDYSQGVERPAATAIRAVLGRMPLEEAVMSGDPIDREVLTVLQEATGDWGVKTTRVERVEDWHQRTTLKIDTKDRH